MKTHNKFMKEVEEASSLPAQTNKALGPDSEEDLAVYLQEHDKLTGEAKEELDALYTTDESEAKA